MAATPPLQLEVARSILAIEAAAWRTVEAADFPFWDYEFLAALEKSGSIGGATGWQPLYLLAYDGAGLAGALCTYAKGHSFGEYIFDWQWARFYAAHGVDYYPKLLAAVPFTPATGPSVLLRPGVAPDVADQLVAAAVELARSNRLSSCHALFLAPGEEQLFARHQFAVRHSLQYHWHNAGYRDFADYTDQMLGKRRRDTLRERRRAQSHGLVIERRTGAELTAAAAVAMDALYHATVDKKEASAYLQPGFFTAVFATMADRILLVTASLDGQIVAAALNFYKGTSLFGRYWGALADYADLHFELCYYQTIDFAIARRLQLFEAGAQGEHKIQRGFLPTTIVSAHRLFHPGLRPAVESYIGEEQVEVAKQIAELSRLSPFKPAATVAN